MKPKGYNAVIYDPEGDVDQTTRVIQDDSLDVVKRRAGICVMNGKMSGKPVKAAIYQCIEIAECG